MLRRTARNVMPVVNDARARYSGMIAKNNLGGSISSARGLADIQSKGVDALSNVQETIELFGIEQVEVEKPPEPYKG